MVPRVTIIDRFHYAVLGYDLLTGARRNLMVNLRTSSNRLTSKRTKCHMISVIHITVKSTAAKPTGKSHDIRAVVM